MALLNYRKREINAKIVYYGPGHSGKTTNVQFIHQKLRPEYRGKLMSLATQTDRTLFFDFLPVELGEINGLNTRFQIYTVPGQVFYNATRKLVLKNVDGVVFVADSQRKSLGANIESFKNLEENLKLLGKSIRNIPLVVQYNKRDMDDVMSIEELEEKVNLYNSPHKVASAHKGDGVLDTLTLISKMVLNHLRNSPEFAMSAQPAAVAKPEVSRTISVGAQAGAASPSVEPAPPLSTATKAGNGSTDSPYENFDDMDDFDAEEPLDAPEEAEPISLEPAEDMDAEMKELGGRPQVMLRIAECKAPVRLNDKTFRIPLVLTDSKGEAEYLFDLTLTTDWFGGSE